MNVFSEDETDRELYQRSSVEQERRASDRQQSERVRLGRELEQARVDQQTDARGRIAHLSTVVGQALKHPNSQPPAQPPTALNALTVVVDRTYKPEIVDRFGLKCIVANGINNEQINAYISKTGFGGGSWPKYLAFIIRQGVVPGRGETTRIPIMLGLLSRQQRRAMPSPVPAWRTFACFEKLEWHAIVQTGARESVPELSVNTVPLTNVDNLKHILYSSLIQCIRDASNETLLVWPECPDMSRPDRNFRVDFNSPWGPLTKELRASSPVSPSPSETQETESRDNDEMMNNRINESSRRERSRSRRNRSTRLPHST